MVTIVAYDESWPQEFTRLAADLRHALGGLALRIDHIGSTSVPGLAAKDLCQRPGLRFDHVRGRGVGRGHPVGAATF